MTTTTTVPPVPVVPTTLTPQGIVAYVGSLALFILGVLTATGVTVPSGIATDVNLIVGAAVSVTGALVPTIVHVFHLSVTKAAIAAGVPAETAVRL